MKTLILYVYHDYNECVKFFLNNALFEDDEYHFLIICNDLNSTIDLPKYVKVFKRENKGFDFGGWSEGLFINNLYKEYDFFLFINSSSIGPFLPSDFLGKWPKIYINGLKDNIHLFGSTINNSNFYNNIDPTENSHIQSYIFSMNKETLDYLIECEIFSINNYCDNLYDAVHQKEILMSRKIIEKGWNIGCLHSYYKNIDFTFKTKLPEDYVFSFKSDVMYVKYFENKFCNIFELVFIKGNRISLNNFMHFT